MNHCLANFPKILADQSRKFDQMVNYFFPDVIDEFMSREDLFIYPVSVKYLVMNFVKLFEV